VEKYGDSDEPKATDVDTQKEDAKGEVLKEEDAKEDDLMEDCPEGSDL